jgi:hypothetical protein
MIRVHRADVKAHEVPTHGRVTRVFPDSGFLGRRMGSVYFHRHS